LEESKNKPGEVDPMAVSGGEKGDPELAANTPRSPPNPDHRAESPGQAPSEDHADQEDTTPEQEGLQESEEPRGEELRMKHGPKAQEEEEAAPAGQQVCPPNFGDSDIYGGSYNDPTP
jgi:hypothetical protein